MRSRGTQLKQSRIPRIWQHTGTSKGKLPHIAFFRLCIKSPKMTWLRVDGTKIASSPLPLKNSLKTTHIERKRKANHFHRSRGSIIMKAAYFFQIYNFILSGILPNSRRKNWASPLICKNLFHPLLSRWTAKQLQQRKKEIKYNQSPKYQIHQQSNLVNLRRCQQWKGKIRNKWKNRAFLSIWTINFNSKISFTSCLSLGLTSVEDGLWTFHL